jgi:ATP-dependent helicase YprA (DUF1998 family)
MYNPAEVSERIKAEFIDYLTTSFSTCEENVNNQFRKELSQIIARGPFVDIKSVFQKGSSLAELIERGDGRFSRLFYDIEKNRTNKVIPPDRQLYSHQVSALNKIVDGKNIVVSTGTGSGKTLCFLLPIINTLLKEIEAGHTTPDGKLMSGVRALIIYPMNALANDQMKFIRKLLSDFDKISFGVYIGATEDEERKALSLYKEIIGGEPLPNEYLSRDKMKVTPPNILITNYAMLEHLLLRPADNAIFEKSDFQFIVLDEAHIYSGATGIETSFLVKRLQARMTTKKDGGTQFILTSATLGEGKDSFDEVVSFAKRLCNSGFDKNDIVTGVREEYSAEQSPIGFNPQLYIDLVDSTISVNDICSKYGLASLFSEDKAEVYYDICEKSAHYHRLRQYLYSVDASGFEIHDIARELGLSVDELIAFLSVCGQAIKSGTTLVDVRYHFFLRALEGAYLSLTGDRKLFLQRQQKYKDSAVFEIAVCKNCGEIGLYGKIEDDHLHQISQRYVAGEDCKYYHFEDDLKFKLDDDSEEEGNLDAKRYFLCSKCGAVTRDKEATHCDCGEHFYTPIIEVEKERCLACGSRNAFKRFYLSNDAATAVIATSLYDSLPEYETEIEIRVSTGGKFGFGVVSENTVTKRTPVTRQFLAFSDSRQEAAFFACYLDTSYKKFLGQRGLVHIIDDFKDDMITKPYSIKRLVDRLQNYFEANKSFSDEEHSDASMAEQYAWYAVVNELITQHGKNSLAGYGYLSFRYKGHDDELISNVANANGISTENARTLLNSLIEDIVTRGAVCLSRNDILSDEMKEDLFYTRNQPTVVITKQSESDVYSMSFCANIRDAEKGKYYPNKRVRLVCDVLGITEEQTNEFLKGYWNDILLSPGNSYGLKLISGNAYAMPVENFEILVSGSPSMKVYKCQRCGAVAFGNIDGKCVRPNCGGTVIKTTHTELVKNSHYFNLFRRNQMSPLIIKEHTAQLSKAEAAEYQKRFIDKKINALSCSTTFEMGVDLDTLETVFLRNVPPLPSNYIQRAGRAGRSTKAAAYALTYAKLSSHDFTYFKAPGKMIAGKIKTPLFSLSNEKVALRHVYAVALSAFLQRNEDVYHGDKADVFLNEDGYQRFYDYLLSKPDSLKDILERSFPKSLPIELLQKIDISSFGWVDGLIGEEGVLKLLVDDYKETIKQFDVAIRESRGNLQEQAKYDRRKKEFMERHFIEFLVRGNILPKYGFPVDTVELFQNGFSEYSRANIRKLQMQRDLQLAIADYAPGSEVVADGRIYRSRYIKRQSVGKKAWTTGYIAKCNNPDCGQVNFSHIKTNDIVCSACKQTIKKSRWDECISPVNGFVAEAKSDPVPMTRPDKNYRSDFEYVGNKERRYISGKRISIGGNAIEIYTTSNDSLLLHSNNEFYICRACGFSYGMVDTEIHRELKKQKRPYGGVGLVDMPKEHHTSNGMRCVSKALTPMKLYHVFKTDVLKIVFDKTSVELFGMASVMYALLETISTTLNIERSDINGCLRLITGDDGVSRFAIILFDSVPGGAGHVRRLVTDDGKVLRTILQNAYSLVANCSCDPSCYNCIRNYANSRIHDNLNRHLAADLLQYYITGEISIEDIREEIPIREEATVDISSEVGTAHAFEDYDDIVDDRCTELARTISEKIGSDPSHADTTLIINQNRKITAEVVWNNERIVLFNESQEEDCAFMEHNAREWIVVFENDGVDEVLSRIHDRSTE